MWIAAKHTSQYGAVRGPYLVRWGVYLRLLTGASWERDTEACLAAPFLSGPAAVQAAGTLTEAVRSALAALREDTCRDTGAV